MSEEAKEPYGVIARRAALWLAFLAPFFYLTYGGANWLAAQRSDVPFIVYGWERYTPFLAWTIIPYWSINAFYAVALFWNDRKRDVDRLAGRYLTAQIVAVACFIAFPLTVTTKQPPTSGLFGFMFEALASFDEPFNQAPSLHIALLVIIWDQFRHKMPKPWLYLWHVWCLLIGVSVLTTWQHQFIDIPTGALLGLFALWLFPRRGQLPFSRFEPTRDRRTALIGAAYALGGLACLAGAWAGAYRDPAWLILLWPALALLIVGFGYLGAGVKVFQKNFDGYVPLASRLLIAPYRLGARINAWLWTSNLPAAVEIGHGLDRADGASTAVFLGRFPTAREANQYGVVLDLAGEFVRPRGVVAKWQSVPMLDLAPISDIERDLAAFIVDAFYDGTVLICCALGFQRSATVAAAWLIRNGRAANFAEAEGILAAAGRPVHLRMNKPEPDQPA